MYQRNDEGQIIDPPVIAARETEIYTVMQTDPGNTRKLERLTREYERERINMAEGEEQDEREAAEDQAAKDAEARDAVRSRTQQDPQQDPQRQDPQRDPQQRDPASSPGFIPGFGKN